MKIGIDLGGSHIAVALIKNDTEIVYKIEQDVHGEDIAELIIELIHKLLEENIINIYVIPNIISKTIEKIGICIPGTISNGVVVKAGNLGLKGYNVRRKIKKRISYDGNNNTK